MTCLWNFLRNFFRTRTVREDDVPSGIYILRYSKSCIKIGMSNDIRRRLKQYKGYQVDARDVKPIMTFKCV